MKKQGQSYYFLRRAHIEDGYRAAKGKGMTFRACNASLFGYLHNESMNVFSHLAPALYFTIHFLLAVTGTASYSVLQTWQSRMFMALVAFGHSFDMWTSVAYHLYNTLGRQAAERLLAFDLSGIVAVMLGNFIVLAYHLFSDWSWERNLIMGVVTPLIVSNFFVLFHPKFLKDSMHCCKVIVIAATQVLLFSTAIAGRVYYGSDYHVEEIYPRLFTAFASVTLGFGFWLSHYPERIHCLGKHRTV